MADGHTGGGRHGVPGLKGLATWGTALALLTAACGDSESGGTATSATRATSATSATTPVAALPIVPEVLCIDAGITNDVAFAYVNEADTAVVLDASGSSVADGDAADFEFVPIVFAPGRVSPAFWITAVADGAETLPAWTVVGPDGVSRTASADAATPACTAELLEPTTADPRRPALEFGDPVVSSGGDSVTFSSELVGVPTDSVCAAGLEPQPVSITTDDGGAGEVSVDGPATEWVVELFPAGEGTGRFGRQLVAAEVLDRCAAGGTTQQVWPGGAFDAIYAGVLVCVTETDGQISLATDATDPDCRSGLPGTGGTRSRPA
jgi:hypothetical protein